MLALSPAGGTALPARDRACALPPWRRRFLLALVLSIVAAAAGCRLTPSNDRDWAPELSRLSTADFNGNLVTVHNVRNCDYRTEEDYDVHYDDRTYDLSRLDSVDYILVPFGNMPRVAHTFLSFGFHGQRLRGHFRRGAAAAGAKTIRRSRISSTPTKSFTSSETSAIWSACGRTSAATTFTSIAANTTPQQSQALFVDMLKRANKLSQAAGVLQHADEQLHDEPGGPRQPRRAEQNSVHLSSPAPRPVGPAGVQSGAAEIVRHIRANANRRPDQPAWPTSTATARISRSGLGGEGLGDRGQGSGRGQGQKNGGLCRGRLFPTHVLRRLRAKGIKPRATFRFASLSPVPLTPSPTPSPMSDRLRRQIAWEAARLLLARRESEYTPGQAQGGPAVLRRLGRSGRSAQRPGSARAGPIAFAVA